MRGVFRFLQLGLLNPTILRVRDMGDKLSENKEMMGKGGKGNAYFPVDDGSH